MAQKVWLVREPGGSLHESEIAHPSLGRNDVLVRIQASGVNPLDTKIRAGKAEHARQSLPSVLGIDMAGIVEELGPVVTQFKSGDEVYGMAGGVGCKRPPSPLPYRIGNRLARRRVLRQLFSYLVKQWRRPFAP